MKTNTILGVIKILAGEEKNQENIEKAQLLRKGLQTCKKNRNLKIKTPKT